MYIWMCVCVGVYAQDTRCQHYFAQCTYTWYFKGISFKARLSRLFLHSESGSPERLNDDPCQNTTPAFHWSLLFLHWQLPHFVEELTRTTCMLHYYAQRIALLFIVVIVNREFFWRNCSTGSTTWFLYHQLSWILLVRSFYSRIFSINDRLLRIKNQVFSMGICAFKMLNNSTYC